MFHLFSKLHKSTRPLSLICLTLVFFACKGSSETQYQVADKQENYQHEKSERTSKSRNIPPKVHEVLNYIWKHHKAPEGHVGGKRFGNFEKLLPQRDADGKIIHYREWDVNPKVNGRNRGAERLVTGNDQSAWYTRNHYKSFIQIR